jgi:hypothetical protein
MKKLRQFLNFIEEKIMIRFGRRIWQFIGFLSILAFAWFFFLHLKVISFFSASESVLGLTLFSFPGFLRTQLVLFHRGVYKYFSFKWFKFSLVLSSFQNGFR